MSVFVQCDPEKHKVKWPVSGLIVLVIIALVLVPALLYYSLK